ncbi:hypothetical protein [Nonomuraea dietziae]|uniref:hypothetical protein n=1 Tax=Nonomuraea dietziae TaxID=65515 RepID=UPI003408B320
MKTALKIVAASAMMAGTLAFGTGTSAAAKSPATTLGYWYVAKVYPNTWEGWRLCWYDSLGAPEWHCKLDSDTYFVNLWKYGS